MARDIDCCCHREEGNTWDELYQCLMDATSHIWRDNGEDSFKGSCNVKRKHKQGLRLHPPAAASGSCCSFSSTVVVLAPLFLRFFGYSGMQKESEERESVFNEGQERKVNLASVKRGRK